MAGILYVMVGAPGSGKSTYLRDCTGWHSEIVSRDAIRFNLLTDGEDYFSHENEVWRQFTHNINIALMNGIDTYADATHLFPAARKKLLRAIHADVKKVVAIVMDTPLETCLERNAKRSGRARVPDATVVEMYNNYICPTFDEGFDAIIHVSTKEMT